LLSDSDGIAVIRSAESVSSTSRATCQLIVPALHEISSTKADVAGR
jgi:hypothetical protein